MSRQTHKRVISVLFCLWLIFNCYSRAIASECEDPRIFSFSIIPTEESFQELSIYRPIINYLSRMTHKPVEFYMPLSYATVIEAMVKKRVDIAVHGPLSYVLAHNRDPNIQVFATYYKKKGAVQEAGPNYKSILITKKGGRFRNISSLEGASVALTDPDSTSGNLIPRVLFKEVIKRPINDFFKRTFYSGGHDLSVLAVFAEKADAAFVASHRLENLIARGIINKDAFNYLWFSIPIPLDPICYRAGLCPDLKDKIAHTFLTLHTQPSCAQFLEKLNADRFVPMKYSDYDIIRRIRAKIDKLSPN